MPWPIFQHCSGLFDYIIIRATTFIQMHEDCQGGFSTPKNNRQGPFQPLNICSQLYLYGIFVVAPPKLSLFNSIYCLFQVNCSHFSRKCLI